MRSTAWTAGVVSVVVLAGALRLFVAESTHPVRLIGDELYYLHTASSIAEGSGHYSAERGAWAAWPPGNAWWLSHFVPARTQVTEAPRAALWGQVVLGALLVLLTAWLGRELFDRRSGLWTGAIAALDPALVAFSHYFWAETLFSVLLVAALIGVVAAERRDSLGVAAASGALFGLAALTRESALPVAGGCALWWLWIAPAARRRAALLRGALLLGAALLVVAPWTVRNHARTGQLVLVSNAGWLALLQGNALRADDWLELDRGRQSILAREFFSLPEAERPAWARERVLELVRGEQPGWLYKKLVLNLSLLFRPDSFVFWKLSHGAYGDVAAWRSRALVSGVIATYVAVLTLAVLGCAAARERGRPSFLLAVVAPLAAIHVLAFASSRYRMPLMPLFIVYAVHFARCSRGLLARLRGSRGAAATAVLLFFFAVCIPHFYAEGLKLWRTGSVF